MVHNCNFNKVALLTDMRRIIWRLDTYRKDADKAGHPLCKELLTEMEKDLKKYSKKLEEAIVGLAKEDKFGFCDKC
ncbi:hypothetical protein KY309_02515 [Candidatus Woesearchaeota archaeon]|nr:hypothetical protein [Candidatus Woesearchaeota archaeon]MBW3016459.1 hypothetical protein [Candidatus Woesearchaeota archaeon]